MVYAPRRTMPCEVTYPNTRKPSRESLSLFEVPLINGLSPHQSPVRSKACPIQNWVALLALRGVSGLLQQIDLPVDAFDYFMAEEILAYYAQAPQSRSELKRLMSLNMIGVNLLHPIRKRPTGTIKHTTPGH
jgi:hypothetical protein